MLNSFKNILEAILKNILIPSIKVLGACTLLISLIFIILALFFGH